MKLISMLVLMISLQMIWWYGLKWLCEQSLKARLVLIHDCSRLRYDYDYEDYLFWSSGFLSWWCVRFQPDWYWLHLEYGLTFDSDLRLMDFHSPAHCSRIGCLATNEMSSLTVCASFTDLKLWTAAMLNRGFVLSGVKYFWWVAGTKQLC